MCAKNSRRSVLLASLFGALLMGGAEAETFRVYHAVTLPVSASGERNTVVAGTNDCIIIELPQDRTFIEGIELSFKVPQEVAAWRDSVVWSLYGNVRPSPTPDRIDYSGVRGSTGTFGTSLSLNLQIPLKSKNTIKKDAYSHYVDAVPDATDGKIFLRLQVAMKGTGDEVYDARFQVTSKPLLIQKGKLLVEAAAPDGGEPQPYTVLIDGKATDVGRGGILLAPGMHDVSFLSDFYRNEMRTVAIAQAQVSTVAITFRDSAPTIRVLAPDGTKVYLDDEPLTAYAVPVTVTQGEHVVRCVIGDYETIRQVSALSGRSYTVSIALDASVTEED